jgi:hypothetical protein
MDSYVRDDAMHGMPHPFIRLPNRQKLVLSKGNGDRLLLCRCEPPNQQEGFMESVGNLRFMRVIASCPSVDKAWSDRRY